MSFDPGATEHDLDPAAMQFGEELRRTNKGGPRDDDFDVDGFDESFGRRILRLFRRDGD
ncbi:MAG: hypothetical protein AAFZ58_16050 [Pseudomonadota bacterium]